MSGASLSQSFALTPEVKETHRSEGLQNPPRPAGVSTQLLPPTTPLSSSSSASSSPSSSFSLSFLFFYSTQNTHTHTEERAREMESSLGSPLISTTWPALIMTHQPGERRSQAGTVLTALPAVPAYLSHREADKMTRALFGKYIYIYIFNKKKKNP